MSYIEVEYPKEKEAFYDMLVEQVKLYIGEERDLTAILANTSSVIAQAFDEVNWVGFYLVDKEKNSLVVGPFQGRPAVSRIEYGKGVCGTAWEQEKPQVVEEVSCFVGHIACDCNTHAEIVIPLRHSDGSIWGVLDMDSTVPGRFNEDDRIGLERVAQILG